MEPSGSPKKPMQQVAVQSARQGQQMQVMQDSVVRDIAEMLGRLRSGAAPITAETDIARDLSLDSLAVMDLMMELEERFDVSIPLNVIPDIQTVADLAAAVERLRGNA